MSLETEISILLAAAVIAESDHRAFKVQKGRKAAKNDIGSLALQLRTKAHLRIRLREKSTHGQSEGEKK